MSLNKYISDMLELDEEILMVITGLLILYFKYNDYGHSLLLNIIIISFILSIFDIYLKKIVAKFTDDSFNGFILNNIITILIINLLFYIIAGYNEKLTLLNFISLTFGYLFYEFIVFKLYDYNNMCNGNFRHITKTVMKLACVHILSAFINGDPYDYKWFNYSFSQIINFGLFNQILE